MATRENGRQPGDYQLLGLAPGADIVTIKQAYRKLAKQWHPDRHRLADAHHQELAERRFREITCAYQRLRHAFPEDAASQSHDQRLNPESPSASTQTGPGSQGESSPADSRTATKGPPSSAIFRALFERRRSWLGLGLGLAMSLAVLILVSQPPPPPPRTVIPPLDEDRFVLTLPNSQAPVGRAEPLSGDRSDRGQLDDLEGLDALGAEPGHFSLGAGPDQVLRAQGPPTRIVGGTWSYGLNEVQFRQGRVQNFNNFDGRLRVKVEPRGPCDHLTGTFSLGSGMNQVLCVQGTPSKVDGNCWYYGFDMIRFKHDEVVEYSNSSGSLKVHLAPNTQTGGGQRHFRIGADKDRVLSIQGTPMEIRNNIWYYDYSDIQFAHDRVRWVNDPTGQIRFMAGAESP
ncbi:MAG: hypothetical protein COT06_00605 [Syntrophobacteraceae bacterium CG07_land_8_20_14_0_80_61_8]|nr:MAG: hypothetical protein COT06_00605 [Syntrophobacteraceae bacterium CG07_land_8_20_14_0_80_61_8]